MALTNFYTGLARALAPFMGLAAANELYTDKALAATGDAVFASDLTVARQTALERGLDKGDGASRNFIVAEREAALPWLQRAADLIGSTPYQNTRAFRRKVVDAIVGEGVYVIARGASYGSNPADSDKGVYRRLTKDYNGQTNEARVFNETVIAKITKTVISGAGATSTEVTFIGGSAEGSNINVLKGSGVSVPRTQAGLTGCVNNNPTLGGNADTDNGDTITDSDSAGDQTSGGITSWGQTRTSGLTVVVDTSKVYGNQDYGIKVGVASKTLTLEQDMEGLGLEAEVPVAVMAPVNNDNGWEGSVTIHTADKSQQWVHGDLTHSTWNKLILDMDEDLYPINWDNTTYNKFKLVVANGAGTGSNTITLGGFYAAKMFQLVPGGPWYVVWEYQTPSQQDDTASFGADSVIETRGLATHWLKMFPDGPSLPISGSTEWAPQAPTAQPEIVVRRNGSNIADGGSVALGSVASGVHSATLRIYNTGYTTLAIGVPTQGSVTNATLTSAGISQPRGIEPGHYYDLKLEVTDGGAGAFSCEVVIGNNDANEAPFNVTISGTAT